MLDERQHCNRKATRARILRPPLPCDSSQSRGVFRPDALSDRSVRMVRKRLDIPQAAAVQRTVESAQLNRSVCQPQVDHMGGVKNLDLTQFDPERRYTFDVFRNLPESSAQIAIERPRRKDRDMGVRLAARRQFQAQIVEKTGQRIGYVRYQRRLADRLRFARFPARRLHF
jgi:hypothetical protein